MIGVEVIELIDADTGDFYRDEIIIRGHHDPIVAMTALVEWLISYEGYDLWKYNDRSPPGRMSYGMPTPGYARWSCEYGSSDNPSFRYLRTYNDRGRGRFPVMISEHIKVEL